jgi:SAM-dependent methyltransferase
VTFDLARRLVTGALALILAFSLIRQCRRPTGWLGRRVARAMNVSHASLTTWGLSHVRIDRRARILDVGCGGGQTIRRMVDLAADGRVDGVDYAPASVAIASQTNAALIQAGRVTVQQASVSSLPFEDRTFDVVTAIETHYYWPDFAASLREVRRVLRPGGQFAIVAETYKGRRMDWLYRPVMTGLFRATYLSLDEHRDALIAAGFANVQVVDDRPHGWMCATGVRPDAD